MLSEVANSGLMVRMRATLWKPLVTKLPDLIDARPDVRSDLAPSEPKNSYPRGLNDPVLCAIPFSLFSCPFMKIVAITFDKNKLPKSANSEIDPIPVPGQLWDEPQKSVIIVVIADIENVYP